MKEPTIKDVARQAGVSIGTVSAVINGKANVRPSTRQLVLDVIKALNYRPRGQARDLRMNPRELSLGLILQDTEDAYSIGIAIGVKQYANEHDYILFIAGLQGNAGDEEDITQIFTSQDVKGAIIAPNSLRHTPDAYLARLDLVNFPFVLLEKVAGLDANTVTIDNYAAARQATAHLIDCGYRHLVHFAGPEKLAQTLERSRGFLDALKTADLPIIEEEHIISCGSHFQQGFQTGMTFFQSVAPSPPPTAVFCYNDAVALGLISALRRLNISIPNQVGIVGFDDTEMGQNLSPALTTIRPPLEELGRRAADILLQIVNSSQSTEPKEVVLDTELIVRETTVDLATL